MKTILIVDDDDVLVGSLTRVFRSRDYVVVAAGNGAWRCCAPALEPHAASAVPQQTIHRRRTRQSSRGG